MTIDLSRLRSQPRQPKTQSQSPSVLWIAVLLLVVWFFFFRGGGKPGPGPNPLPVSGLHVLLVTDDAGTSAQKATLNSSKWLDWAEAKPAELRRYASGQDLGGESEVWREMRKLAATPPAIVVAGSGRPRALPVPDSFDAAVQAVEAVR